MPGGELRFLSGEVRPYVLSFNLFVHKGRVIYISDAGAEHTTLPMASQLEQDEYAWFTMTNDQMMPWSNAMVYGVIHDLVPWVKPDLDVLTYQRTVTLDVIKTWLECGDCFLESLDVSDLFSNDEQHPATVPGASNDYGQLKYHERIDDLYSNDYDQLKCHENIDDL